MTEIKKMQYHNSFLNPKSHSLLYFTAPGATGLTLTGACAFEVTANVLSAYANRVWSAAAGCTHLELNQ